MAASAAHTDFHVNLLYFLTNNEYQASGVLHRDLAVIQWTLYGLACAFSLSARKAPMASSACAAAFNLPTLPGNPCGIPIHTSARASTPAVTARSIYRSESSNSTSSSPT